MADALKPRADTIDRSRGETTMGATPRLQTAYTKLVTHEDRYHLHKTMGLYVLLHFVYQVGRLFGSSGQPATYLPWYALLPHAVLHASAFRFKVLSRRPAHVRSNMFIWEELRLHAGIFAGRALGVIMWPRYSGLIVMLTMAAADLATAIVGTEGTTTVRGHHSRPKTSWLKRSSAAFFSCSQLGGTLLCSGVLQPGGRPHPLLAFVTLPAIQTSAFGMTLLRKNLIAKHTWQVVYSAELVLAFAAWHVIYGTPHLILGSLVAYALRRLGVSKYALWGIALAAQRTGMLRQVSVSA